MPEVHWWFVFPPATHDGDVVKGLSSAVPASGSGAVGSALGLGPRCRKFESFLPDKNKHKQNTP